MRPRICKSLVVLVSSIAILLVVSVQAQSSDDIDRNSIKKSDDSEAFQSVRSGKDSEQNLSMWNADGRWEDLRWFGSKIQN